MESITEGSRESSVTNGNGHYSTNTLQVNEELEQMRREIELLRAMKTKTQVSSVLDESPQTRQVREQLEQMRMENEKLMASRQAAAAQQPGMTSRTYQTLHHSFNDVPQAEQEYYRGPGYDAAGYPILSSPSSHHLSRSASVDYNGSRISEDAVPTIRSSPAGMSSRTVQAMEELNALKQEVQNLKHSSPAPSLSSRTNSLPAPAAPPGSLSRSVQARREEKPYWQENAISASKVGQYPPAVSSRTVEGHGDQTSRLSPRTVEAQGDYYPRSSSRTVEAQGDYNPRSPSRTVEAHGDYNPRSPSRTVDAHGDYSPRSSSRTVEAHGDYNSRSPSRTVEGHGDYIPRSPSRTVEGHGDYIPRSSIRYVEGHADHTSHLSPRTVEGQGDHTSRLSPRKGQVEQASYLSPKTQQAVGENGTHFSSRTLQALEDLNRLKQEREKLVASKVAPTRTADELRKTKEKPVEDVKLASRPAHSVSIRAADVSEEAEKLRAREGEKYVGDMTSRTLAQVKNNGPVDYTKSKGGKPGTDVSMRTLQALDELAKIKKEVEMLKASKTEVPVMSDRTRQVMEQLEKVKRENALLKSSKVEALTTAQRRLAYYEQNHAAASKIRTEEIKQMILTSQELDLAFLVDATGSMQMSIDMIKNTVTSMASGILEFYPQCKLRVAFAPYRDYENIDQDDSEACDFTTDFVGPNSAFAKALSRVHASGGGDDAEDVFTGIGRVASLSWSSTNRLLFHIADAPCHGLQFHDGVGDQYPGGDKFGRTIEAQLQILREVCHISTYFFCHLNSSTRKMLREFKKAAGDSIQILEEQFENISKIPHKVVTLCRGTIQKTLSVVAAAQPVDPNFVNEIVLTTQPSWSDIPVQTGIHFRFDWYRALDDMLSKINSKLALDQKSMGEIQVQIAKNPFSSEGAVRWPYYAIIRHLNDSSTSSMVVKRFKTPLNKDVREIHKKDRYLAQMEVQSVAQQMANEFNNSISNFKNVKKVEFTQVTTIEVGSGVNTKFYNMEPLLQGEWIRYSNNGGYVNTSDYTAVLQAFTHWTHVRSRGLLMVTDLQGVRRQNEFGENVFSLCDPAIHCTDVMRFTRTNLGQEGFKLFFDTHKCNDVCKNLNLPVGTAGRTISGTQVGSYW